ncbi:hypothetical protein Tcan_00848, partial [Toxocara canis]
IHVSKSKFNFDIHTFKNIVLLFEKLWSCDFLKSYDVIVTLKTDSLFLIKLYLQFDCLLNFPNQYRHGYLRIMFRVFLQKLPFLQNSAIQLAKSTTHSNRCQKTYWPL